MINSDLLRNEKSAPENKYIPRRKCCACGKRFEKKELLRIALDSQGSFKVDMEGHLHGRGAYVCRTGDCIKRTVDKRFLDRSFRKRVDASVYECLKEIINRD